MSKSAIKRTFKPKKAIALAALAFATAACQNTTPNSTGAVNPTPTANSTGATQTTSATTPATSSAKDGLKIGSLLPATGDLSAIGQPMIAAVPLLVETVNKCGGVNGKPVTLVSEDDQTDPKAGGAGMTKLAEIDRVAGVVGSFASSVSSAAVDIAARNKVMLISPGSTSPVFTGRAQKGDFQGYWARTAPPDTYQAQALAKLASEKGFKRVSTVVINNDYGVGFEKEFVQAFKKLGGTVVNENKPTRYDPKATTFDTEASAAFAGKPDAVAAVLYAETGSLLLKSAAQQGLSQGVTVMLTDGVYSPDFPGQVGKTSDGKFILSGAIGTVPGANGKALADLTKLWKEKQGKEVSAYVPHSWDAAALLALAAEAAKSNTGEGIKSKIRDVANAPGEEVSDVCKALELVRQGKDINYQGASGNVDIDESGDVVGSYDVWAVKDDGKLAVTGKVSPK
ncbi:ABC transporter substrate-binding protein [Argonema antarcticum]|uniref:ABC transporter substrate-binding protein n=1 Tax=Argonema antarcticum TaxID=2942763 RepID=UPI002012C5D8|nr:ABC transporter substrate-binding protein [Argonema antarcticum]MCL1474531.1 ABC transporter substrate-binding protein [Argonema antarcticum A004/B2]